MVGVKHHASNAISGSHGLLFCGGRGRQHMYGYQQGCGKLAPSNLHKLVSGKKYAGGSKGEGRKASFLKELEERSEKMVKVIRKKAVSSVASSSKSRGRAGKAKSSETVKVTKTLPKLISLPFLDNKTLAAGTRGARKKQKGDETEKK